MAKIKRKSTVIYTTANIEDHTFEKNIRQNLLNQSGGLKIISVSRLKTKFGNYRITVGKKTPINPTAFFKQILRGLKKVKTKYVFVTKADCLYPPAYFEFIPPNDDRIYVYKNCYSLTEKFWLKEYSNGTICANTKYLFDAITEFLKNPKSSPNFDHNWTGDLSVINIVTKNSQRRFPKVVKNTIPRTSLPYWGDAKTIKSEIYTKQWKP